MRRLQSHRVGVNSHRCIKKDRKHTHALYNRGVCYDRLKEYRKAVSDFSRLVAMKSNLSTVYFNRAQAYESLGENRKAVADYNAGVKVRNEELRQAKGKEAAQQTK